MSFPAAGSPRRVAIVDGMRTPFARAWTAYRHLGAADLGAAAVNGLLRAADLDPAQVDQLIFGCVAATPHGPHIGREVVFRSALPDTVPSVTVQLYCASGARAVVDAANEIALGHADVVIAGGAESMSEAQALVPKRLTHALNDAARAKSLGRRLRAFRGVSLADVKPEAPGIVEPTLGKSMGQCAELMAKEMGISREEQDAWAHQSHQRSHAAYEACRLKGEVAPMHLAGGPAAGPAAGSERSTTLERDTDIRPETSRSKLAKLRPVFDRVHGTVTAGNASPLTDGAAAVLLMSEERAGELGFEPLAYLRSYAMAAVDLQKEHLLLGPAYSAPVALRRAGLSLDEIPLIEMHEAFAAQVLATLQRFESRDFAQALGLDRPITNQVDRERLNPNGGSLAVGHPFGATGARVISQCAHEMQSRDLATAFVSVCAGGGHGFSMVLER